MHDVHASMHHSAIPSPDPYGLFSRGDTAHNSSSPVWLLSLLSNTEPRARLYLPVFNLHCLLRLMARRNASNMRQQFVRNILLVLSGKRVKMTMHAAFLPVLCCIQCPQFGAMSQVALQKCCSLSMTGIILNICLLYKRKHC